MKHLYLFMMAFGVCSIAAATVHGQSLVFNNLSVGGAANVDQSSLADLDSIAVATATADGIVSFASDTNVTSVEFTGLYSGTALAPATDNITIQILDGSSGSPGGVVAGGNFAVGNNLTRSDSGFDLGTNDLFSFSVPIDFTFAAGDEFFFAFFNDTAGFGGTFEIGSAGGEGDGFFGSFDGGSSFPSSAPGGVDFQLFGSTVAVPEPASAGLIGLVIVAGAFQRRKKP